MRGVWCCSLSEWSLITNSCVAEGGGGAGGEALSNRRTVRKGWCSRVHAAGTTSSLGLCQQGYFPAGLRSTGWLVAWYTGPLWQSLIVLADGAVKGMPPA